MHAHVAQCPHKPEAARNDPHFAPIAVVKQHWKSRTTDAVVQYIMGTHSTAFCPELPVTDPMRKELIQELVAWMNSVHGDMLDEHWPNATRGVLP